MKGKYQGKRTQKRNRIKGLFVALIVILCLLLVVEVVWLLSLRNKNSDVQPDFPEISTENTEPQISDTSDPAVDEEVFPSDVVNEPESSQMQSINLGYGLILEQIGCYTGAYMEDGSNEILSDILMATVRNDSDQDLQYAKISVLIGDATYLFEVTDLPSGAKVILLDKNRAAYSDDTVVSALLENHVFYDSNMDMHADMFEITGNSGVLNVHNISGQDISGDIYVHYKLNIQDVFYGGIAYRVKIEGGLMNDEIRQIMTSHFDPTNCVIVNIEYGI